MKTCVICKSPSVDDRGVLCAAHVDEWLKSPEGRRAMEALKPSFFKFDVTDGKIDHFLPTMPAVETAAADFIRRLQAERLNGSIR